MVTEVKLEGLQVLTNAQSLQHQKRKVETVAANNTGDAVTVSNQLSSMISSLSVNEESSHDADRVREAQQSIQNGHYRVDVDALASKLYHQLIPTKTGTF